MKHTKKERYKEKQRRRKKKNKCWWIIKIQQEKGKFKQQYKIGSETEQKKRPQKKKEAN